MAGNLSTSRKLAVVILAAGKGKRMNNPEMAKVMYEINGKPMVDYVVGIAGKLRAHHILLIVGWQKQSVSDYISKVYSNVEFIDQVEQLGTGHAVLQAEGALNDFEGDLLILSGDVPLLTDKTVKALIGYHQTSGALATILTAELDDPKEYGRIIRNDDGSVQRIVEDRDASKKELKVDEINSGIYVFDKKKLFECLKLLKPNNRQGEYYLTDVFEHFWKNRWKVSAVKAIDSVEIMGINDMTQLERTRTLMALRSDA